MPESHGFLQAMMSHADLLETMARDFEFDIRRRELADGPRMTSGRPLDPVAGDFTGGMFYLYGGEGTRQVLYASSEGDAGIIAKDLPDLIGLVVGLPFWRDCLAYSSDGDLTSMETAAELLFRDIAERDPEMATRQLHLAELLGFSLEPVPVLVQRLHVAVRSADPADRFIDETGEYGSLFGPFAPGRNPRWR